MMKKNREIKKIIEEGGDITKIPVMPAQKNDDYVECEFCHWWFAPLTAEWHIPHCKNLVHRPKPPPHMRK